MAHSCDKCGGYGCHACRLREAEAESARLRDENARLIRTYDHYIPRNAELQCEVGALMGVARQALEALEEAVRWTDESEEGASCPVCGVLRGAKDECWLGLGRAAITRLREVLGGKSHGQ